MRTEKIGDTTFYFKRGKILRVMGPPDLQHKLYLTMRTLAEIKEIIEE